MSSAVLYLAIVAVWGVVLVPMWLRRDGDGIGRLLHRRHDVITADLGETAPHVRDDDVVTLQEVAAREVEPEHAELGRSRRGGLEAGRSEARPEAGGSPAGRPVARGPEAGVPQARRRRVTRGAVIARRRRRTLGLTLLALTAIVTTAVQVTPWWFVFPPVVLLAGHLSLLRVAVRMDQEARRAEHRRAAAFHAERLRRAEEEREAREARAAEEAARTAEVIELHSRQEVYDQYTDLRAVGD